MTSRGWEALVVEGRRLAEADPLDRWAIGDLAIEAVPPGKGRAERSAVQEKLKEFSAASGISLSVLKDCHRTSEAWPLGSRIPGISQAKHSRYGSRPNRLNLLLNDSLAEGMSTRLREKVEKAEELLSDRELRQVFLDRSQARSRHIRAAARAIEDEELTKARSRQKAQEQERRARLAEPEIISKAAERAIRCNTALARMVVELIELKSLIHDVPGPYHDRIEEYLSQINRASEQVILMLRPAKRSPQPRTIVAYCEDQPGAEHS
jgi:hypothetical protein